MPSSILDHIQLLSRALLPANCCLGQADFEPDVPMITLAPSETRKCVNITIINDEIVERLEPFEVIITFPPGQPALQIGEIVPPAMQINGTINIIDDDGELMSNEA